MKITNADIVSQLERALPPKCDAAKHIKSSALKRIHLAIMHEPFLSFIQDGSKTIESRFYRRKFAPFGQIGKGDLVLFKRAGGKVETVGIVSDAWSYNIEDDSLKWLKDKFSTQICATDESFWDARQDCLYAILVWIEGVVAVDSPVNVEKRDRRGWMVVQDLERELNFSNE